MKEILMIGAGGFLGSTARYGLSRLLTNAGGFFATMWGTFTANILGCLLLGLIYGFSERVGSMGQPWRLFLTVGFCGGFTTFSTFIHENFTAMSEGRFLQSAAYGVASLILGLGAVWAGHLIAEYFRA